MHSYDIVVELNRFSWPFLCEWYSVMVLLYTLSVLNTTKKDLDTN